MRANNLQFASLMNTFIILAIGITIVQEFFNAGNGVPKPMEKNRPTISTPDMNNIEKPIDIVPTKL